MRAEVCLGCGASPQAQCPTGGLGSLLALPASPQVGPPTPRTGTRGRGGRFYGPLFPPCHVHAVSQTPRPVTEHGAAFALWRKWPETGKSLWSCCLHGAPTMYPGRHCGNAWQEVAPVPRHLTVGSWRGLGDTGRSRSWAGRHCRHPEPRGSQVHFILAQAQLNLLPTKKQAFCHRPGDSRAHQALGKGLPMAAPSLWSALKQTGHCPSENWPCSRTLRDHRPALVESEP